MDQQPPEILQPPEPTQPSQPLQPPREPARLPSQMFSTPQSPMYPSLPPPVPKKASAGVIVGGIFLAILILFCVGVGGVIGYQAGKNSVQQPTSNSTSVVQSLTETPAQTAPTQPPAGAWHEVQKFTGSENTQTELFTAPAEWRIVWSDTITSSIAGAFTLELYSSNGQLVDLIVATQNTANEVYNAHALPGTFYFKIGADGASYTVEVQVMN